MKDEQSQLNAQQHSHAELNPSNLEDKSTSLPDWDTHRQGLKGSVYLSKVVEERSYVLLPLLGYGLLVFALVDYAYIIVPPRFTDPAWEVRTIGALVEHAAPPLLGLMFIFYRHQGYIKTLERKFLGFLSWISLLVGLLYLLMLPLGIGDTWRLYNSLNAQITTQVSQQSQQFEQLKNQLNQAKTDEEIKKLVVPPAAQRRLMEMKNSQALKKQFLSEISKAEQSIKAQADSTRTNQQRELLKNSLRWHLGALVAGTLFILIWHYTDWARIKQ